jgi:hypothetical protein
MAFNRDNSDSLGWTQGIDSGDNSFKISEDGDNLETNPRIVILSGGNVGIGTTSPTHKLEMRGGDVHFENTSSSNTFLDIKGSSANAYIRAYSDSNSVWLYQGGSSSYLQAQSGSTLRLGSGTSNVVITDTSGEVMRTSAGNVGIGTTSPTYKLDVESSGNIIANFESTTNKGAIRISDDDTVGYISAENGRIGFGTSPILSTSNITMLTSNNNVGIGTTSPGAKLDVAGTGNFTGLVSGITPVNAANFVTKAYADGLTPGAGVFLPLAGGTMTGTNGVLMPDNFKLKFGDATTPDLQIYHDGSNSYIDEVGQGSLYNRSTLFIVQNIDSTKNSIIGSPNAAVKLYYNGVLKLETTSTGASVTGTATATTFSGDLNGTINTVTTAPTKPNATNDTTVATTAFVQNLIGTIPAGLVFQGTWNADTNTPTLASGTGTTGHFYIVSTEGSTNLDGITDWKVGDWAVFVEQGATDAWEKVDNSSVLDGSGTGNQITKWAGSGTSNTLTDSIITDNGTSVGIGTTLPGAAYKLEVNGLLKANGGFFTNPVSIFDISATENPRLSLGRASGETLNFDVDDRTAIIYHKQDETSGTHKLSLSVDSDSVDTSTIDFNFRNSAGTTITSTPMTILSSGRVGIGTSNPQVELQVEYTDTHTSGDLALSNSALDIYNNSSADVIGKGSTLTFSDNYSGTNKTTRAAIKGGTDTAGNTADGFLAFYTDTGGANSMQEHMRIDNDGEVLIGTTTPTGAKLLVDHDNFKMLELKRSGNTKARFIADSNHGQLDLYNSATVSTISLLASGDSYLNGGNVGIGTTSPSQKLDVAGNMRMFNVNTASIDLRHSSDYQGSIVRSIRDTGPDAQDYGSSMLQFLTNDNSTTSASLALSLSSEKNASFYGNVGIATTTPTEKLQVTGNISASGDIRSERDLEVGYNNTNYNQQLILNNGLNKNYIFTSNSASISNAQLTIQGGNYTHAVNFKDSYSNQDNYATLQGGYTGDSKLVLFNSSSQLTTTLSTGDSFFAGDVGIGTNSPSGLLHVSSGTSGDAVVIIESDTDNNNENDNPQLQFKQDGGVTIAKAGLTGDAGQIFGNSLGNAAYFGNDQNASVQFYTNATAALTIREDGDVGIGTTSPSQKLHVDGNARVTGAYYDSNNSPGTSGQILSSTATGTDWIDNAHIPSPAPVTPGSITSTIVGETIEIEFDESTTSNIDYYQVWSSDDGGDFGIIAQITPTDFSSTMTVVDTTFVTGGTMSYRVYAVKSGVYSSPGTTSIVYTVGALDVTDMTVINLNTAYYIQYEKPASRFIDHIEIYMDSQTTQGALNRSNASIVYSGQNTSFMKSVGVSNNFHQFWVEVVTT